MSSVLLVVASSVGIHSTLVQGRSVGIPKDWSRLGIGPEVPSRKRCWELDSRTISFRIIYLLHSAALNLRYPHAIKAGALPPLVLSIPDGDTFIRVRPAVGF